MTKIDFLKSVAHLVWWKKEEEALQDPEFLIRQVMNYGNFEQIKEMESLYTREELIEIIRNTLPGEMLAKSWNYWHIRLFDIVDAVPPLPEGIYPGGDPVRGKNAGVVLPSNLDIVDDSVRRYCDENPDSQESRLRNEIRDQERKRIAVNMILMGFAYVHITQATGLSKNDVKSLIKNNKSSMKIREK